MSDRTLDLSGPDRLVSLVGEIATVRTTEPLPAGARVALGLGAGETVAIAAKVVDARRSGDGFCVRLRLFSCPRGAREALAARLAPAPDPA